MIDAKIVLYTWKTTSLHKPMTQTISFSDKNYMISYVEHIFVQPGKNPWICIRLGHDCPRQAFEAEELRQKLNSKAMLCYTDLIQSADMACIGWLLGAHPRSFNAKEFIRALRAHPLIKGKDIEIRLQGGSQQHHACQCIHSFQPLWRWSQPHVCAHPAI